MLRASLLLPIAASAILLASCGGGSSGAVPPATSAAPGAPVITAAQSIVASSGVSSACYLIGYPQRCVAVNNGGDIPYDSPLVLRLSHALTSTSATVSPSATVYAYGGVGTNSVAIRWRRTPGVMYTVTSNGARFSVTTTSPVQMPSVPSLAKVTGRYCVMGHSWTLNSQTVSHNVLIDSAEQAVANAGATCARVEIQSSYVWGGTTGSLSGANANFSRYDYIAGDLARHGISMFPIILQYGGSQIQRTVGTNKAFASASDYGTYAATVTRWIKQHNAQMASQGLPQITHVELMNEPNQSYWFMDKDTGSGIAAFLKAGYKAVKFVDPALFVYGPGLANGGGSHTNMYSDLSKIYADGCHTGVCWDGISIHNYAWQMDPTVYYGPTFEGQWQNYRGVEAIASARGDSSVKICLTETGFASDSGAWGEDPRVAARDLSLAYKTALADPRIACIVNASLWDGDAGGSSYGAIGLGSISTGLWVANPRYYAFAEWAR